MFTYYKWHCNLFYRNIITIVCNDNNHITILQFIFNIGVSDSEKNIYISFLSPVVSPFSQRCSGEKGVCDTSSSKYQEKHIRLAEMLAR